VSGPAEPTRWTDRLLIGYALGMAAVAAVAGPPGARGRLALGHLAVAAVALALAALDRGEPRPGLTWLHRWFPVVALMGLYGTAGALRHVLVPHDLDPLITRWDVLLFPGRWYLAGARLPEVVLEAFHAVYFSYYLLLFVPALAAERRDRREVDRYLFALTLTMLAHYALNLLLPVSGPLAARAEAMPAGRVFVPLMDALYARFDRGGLAFPSTHVAAGLVAAWFAGRRFFPRAAPLYAIWFLLVAASTVVCGFHYPIDVLAGLLSGTACLALAWRWGGARPRAATP
jgi:membrane-associated phospholipid phosphatase